MKDQAAMRIPKDHTYLDDEIRQACLGVLESGQYYMGPQNEQFESGVAASIGVRHAVAVNSGTSAFFLILKALKIGPGDEVLIPAIGFVTLLLHGVRLAGVRGEHNVAIEVISSTLVSSQHVDVVALCVPPVRLESALDILRAVPAGYRTVVSFLGGLATFRLAGRVAAPPVAAVANFESRVRSDGVVEIGFDNFLWLGELDGHFTDRLANLQAATSWVAPTFVTRVIRDMVWAKVIYSLEVALSTLVDARPDEVFAAPGARRIAAAMVRENLRLAEANGATPAAFDFFDPNLYGVQNEGQASTMDTWFSPFNPSGETGILLKELEESATQARIALPVTKTFMSVFDEVRAGTRPLSWRNFEDLEHAMTALHITVPIPRAG